MIANDKEIANAKSKLRDFYRKERKARFITDSWIHILAASEFNNLPGKNIASYLSYDIEPSTSDIGFQMRNLLLLSSNHGADQITNREHAYQSAPR